VSVFSAPFFRVVTRTFRRFSQERVPEAAAGMAFYAIFSLFPLLLIAVAVGSRFVESADVQDRMLSVLLKFLPISRDFVRQNVLSVIRVRGAVGGIGLIGLVWSATGAFSTLVRNLDRAWGEARPRTLVGERLAALAMVASVVGLAVLYLVAKSFASVASGLTVAQRTIEAARHVAELSSGVGIALLMAMALMLLYRLLPRTVVLWREAAVGAATATLALWGVTSAFSAFVSGGMVRYNVVYGSLGTLLALMSWVYLAGLISLVGAHVAASVAHVTRATSGDGRPAGGESAGADEQRAQSAGEREARPNPAGEDEAGEEEGLEPTGGRETSPKGD
jgi:membrane protein